MNETETLDNIAIAFDGVTKSYEPGIKVLDDIHLKVLQGEMITLIGPSGCGKTTLIKLINHLMDWDHGDIWVMGKRIKEWDTIALRRSIGYVIQQTGLFPHMTVGENIAYVLNVMRIPKVQRRARALELLELVRLPKQIIDRHPHALSGGQAQRVGVARALAADPPIILMDEPFGAVDDITRRSLQEEMHRLHQVLNKTILFVTHDIEEALKLGEKIVLMRDGRIEQIGSKKAMIFHPKSQYVEDFFGHKNYSAYLSITTLQEVRLQKIRSHVEGHSHGPVLPDSATLLEAIRLMQQRQSSYISVEHNGEWIGDYTLKDS